MEYSTKRRPSLFRVYILIITFFLCVHVRPRDNSKRSDEQKNEHGNSKHLIIPSNQSVVYFPLFSFISHASNIQYNWSYCFFLLFIEAKVILFIIHVSLVSCRFNWTLSEDIPLILDNTVNLIPFGCLRIYVYHNVNII